MRIRRNDNEEMIAVGLLKDLLAKVLVKELGGDAGSVAAALAKAAVDNYAADQSQDLLESWTNAGYVGADTDGLRIGPVVAEDATPLQAMKSVQAFVKFTGKAVEWVAKHSGPYKEA